MVDSIWLTIILGGLLTFLIRFSFIYLSGRWQPPSWLARALRFVPPAVLSAIIFPEVLMRGNELNLAFGNLRLWAALLAVGVAWRTKSVLLSIAAGMASLYLLTWLTSVLIH
jgi:branched-subunit amino acid transport protein